MSVRYEQPEPTIRDVLRRRQRETRESVSMHKVQVAQIREVTPRMRRVTLEGASLENFPVSGLPADAVRVFLPGTPGAERISRAYTIRRFDRPSREMDIDVLCHEHGPGGVWARGLVPGDQVEFLGTRHEFWAAPSTQFHLLVGDESALPAISQAWIAGETGSARSVRRHLIGGVLPRTAVRAVGYWRAHTTMTELDREHLASGREDPELE